MSYGGLLSGSWVVKMVKVAIPLLILLVLLVVVPGCVYAQATDTPTPTATSTTTPTATPWPTPFSTVIPDEVATEMAARWPLGPLISARNALATLFPSTPPAGVGLAITIPLGMRGTATPAAPGVYVGPWVLIQDVYGHYWWRCDSCGSGASIEFPNPATPCFSLTPTPAYIRGVVELKGVGGGTTAAVNVRFDRYVGGVWEDIGAFPRAFDDCTYPPAFGEERDYAAWGGVPGNTYPLRVRVSTPGALMVRAGANIRCEDVLVSGCNKWYAAGPTVVGTPVAGTSTPQATYTPVPDQRPTSVWPTAVVIRPMVSTDVSDRFRFYSRLLISLAVLMYLIGAARRLIGAVRGGE